MKKLLSTFLLLYFTLSFSQAKKFMFVVIKGEEVTSVSSNGKTWSEVTKISDVIEVNKFSKDRQAYIENEVVKNFLLYTTFGNRVKSKKSYIFNSYYEASKKRDSFLFSE